MELIAKSATKKWANTPTTYYEDRKKNGKKKKMMMMKRRGYGERRVHICQEY